VSRKLVALQIEAEVPSPVPPYASSALTSYLHPEFTHQNQ
jgi:hypothetical protein